jgi:hypothetical protein
LITSRSTGGLKDLDVLSEPGHAGGLSEPHLSFDLGDQNDGDAQKIMPDAFRMGKGLRETTLRRLGTTNWLRIRIM